MMRASAQHVAGRTLTIDHPERGEILTYCEAVTSTLRLSTSAASTGTLQPQFVSTAASGSNCSPAWTRRWAGGWIEDCLTAE